MHQTMATGAYFLLLGSLFLFTVLFLQGMTYTKAKSCGIVKLCFTFTMLKTALWLLVSILVGTLFFFLTVRAVEVQILSIDFAQTMAAILGGTLLCFAAAMLTGFGFLTKCGWFGFGMGSPLRLWAEETNGEIIFYRMERLAGGGEVPKKHMTFERSRENREKFAEFLQNENI